MLKSVHKCSWDTSTATVFVRDVVIKRSTNTTGGMPRSRGDRRAISHLSDSAKRNLKHTFRNVVGLEVMFTLTYPNEFPMDGETVKKHWAAIRRWFTRKGRKGCWFLEFQSRGAAHFHGFLDGEVPYGELALAWYQIVGSGDSKHLSAGTRIEHLREKHAAALYAVKYAAKADQKEPPEGFKNVGRFWGTFGGLKPEPVAVSECTSPVVVEASTGEIRTSETVLLTRVARGLLNAKRRGLGLPKFRDQGVAGFRVYDSGPALKEYLYYLRGSICNTEEVNL